ncbi:MAG: TetR/AcrR family transcriptional regulator [Actinomycetota bacterium]
MISKRGVGRLALADVARRDRLSTPSLYHYFANRRALVLAVLRAEVEELLAAWPQAAGTVHPPQRRLREFMDAQTDYLTRTSPRTVAFILGSLLEAPQDEDVSAVVAPVFGRAESLFRECCAELGADWPPVRRGTVADVLRACLAGLFLMRALGARVDAAAVESELLRALRLNSSK